MSMTIPQKKYFCKRIDEILAQKTHLINKEKVSHLNEREVADCMIDGNIKKLKILSYKTIKTIVFDRIRNGAPGWRHEEYMGDIKVKDLILNYEEKKEQYHRECLEENREIDKKIRRLQEKASEIKDQAMFGNEQEAYEMLEDFQYA